MADENKKEDKAPLSGQVKSVMTEEVARVEIDIWLKHKKIGKAKREANQDQIDSLVSFMCDGVLTMDPDSKKFNHVLQFPIESEIVTKDLEYVPRLKMLDIHTKLQGVKPGDADGRILAYVAALTGKAKQIIRSLDTVDYDVAQAIAIFFI